MLDKGSDGPGACGNGYGTGLALEGKTMKMKTGLNKGFWMVAMTGMLALGACSSSTEQQGTMDAKPESTTVAPAEGEVNTFGAERQKLEADLHDLKARVDARLGEVNTELARTDLKAAERTTAEAMKAQLEEAEAKLSHELSNLEGATEGTWGEVKEGADKVSQDMKGWWDGLKAKAEETPVK